MTSALRSPYAAIEVTTGEGPARVAAERGTLPDGAVPLRLPLTASGAHVGDLVVAPRRPTETFNDADRRLLAGLAHHAGVSRPADDLPRVADLDLNPVIARPGGVPVVTRVCLLAASSSNPYLRRLG